MLETIFELIYVWFYNWTTICLLFFCGITISYAIKLMNLPTKVLSAPLVAFLGIVIFILGTISLGWNSYNHIAGHNAVRDLEVQFLANDDHMDTQGYTDQFYKSPGNLIELRNQRLHNIGLCVAGDWWTNKSTGEPPSSKINTVYISCGNY